MDVLQDNITLIEKEWECDVITNQDGVFGTSLGGFNLATLRLDDSNFTRDISESDSPIVVYFDAEDQDGVGEEGGFINGVWDFITGPIRGIYRVIEGWTTDSDSSQPVAPISLPLRLHPTTSDLDRYYDKNGTGVGRVHLSKGEGVIGVEFTWEFNLITPLDRGIMDRKLSAVRK